MTRLANGSRHSSRRLRFWSLLILLPAGCGPPQTYPVTGAILYGGKPAPAGKITFEPDPSKGNHGPTGFALIKDGQFDTQKGGAPVVAGRIIVRVQLGDGQAVSSEQPFGQPLIQLAETRIIMPRKPHILNLELPEFTRPPEESKNQAATQED